MDKKSVYLKLMQIGKSSGCHQKPERSFFYHGYQFPVCARCTGVVLGQIAGMITFPVYRLSDNIFGFFLFVMFFDWFLQWIKIVESTNFRRLITGLVCGYALGQLYLKIIIKVVYFIYGL